MRKLFVIAIACCLIAGCGKTTQLTNITTPEDNHQIVAVKPESSSGWSSYWRWGAVFVGITGLILGYRHRGELNSAYHKVRFSYMKNADSRFFPDEPNQKIDVPNNQNNNPVPEDNNFFGIASNAQSQIFNNPQNNVPANNFPIPQFGNNPQNNDFKANASPVPQPDYHPGNPLFQRGHRNSPSMQQVLNQRTPIQDDFIHQLPQANEQNFQNQPDLFVLGDNYDHVYYQQNGVIYEAPQVTIDSAIAALGAFYGN
jgi:hypothetical protein